MTPAEVENLRAECELLRGAAAIVRKLAAGHVFYAIEEAKAWVKTNPRDESSKEPTS